MTTTLPTLYKRTSTGATQQWQISVEGSTLITTFGQKDGKLQEARDTITVGKNIGRANETTPEQQALSEAQAQWEKKQKNKGYVQSLDAALAGEIDSTFVAGGINPMLAHTYEKQGHKISYPAYTQPKLDGHRCIAIIENGVATLWSRTRKPITGVPHIVKALEALASEWRWFQTITLDGELYNHDYRDRFEELTSFIKRPEPKPGHETIQFHIYDVVDDRPFVQRAHTLRVIEQGANDPLVIVATEYVQTEEQAMQVFEEFVEQGYEGSMLRNSGSLYVYKRSYDLIKVKTMADAEWPVVAVETGRGKMADKAVFVCETASGDRFRVKMKGTLDSLRQYVDDPALAIGRMLTVQYQNLTAEGLPRFPVGLRLREDI